MTTPLESLKQGDFLYMAQEHKPDGSVVITLLKHNDNKPTRFRIKDLYGPNEQEVDVATGKPIA